MPDVYVTITLTLTEKRRLEAGLDGADVYYAADAGEREAAFQEAAFALGSPEPAWVARSERLRWLQLNSAGYDPYLDLDWERLGRRLVVTNMAGLFAEPVAETALAGLLHLYRGLGTLADLQRRATWEGAALRPRLRTLHGARVVILGPGSIGLALKRLLAAFACRITVLGRRSPEADIYSLEALDAALPEADVACCCLPENGATRGLFSRERLGLLRPSALFVNVGRGSVVDEGALVDALRDGRLGGAVLDVTEEEPLPPDHPLWTCPNTLLTQHTGGGSAEEQAQKVDVFLDNLRRLRAGKPLRHVVRFA